jgi:MFS family permease
MSKIEGLPPEEVSSAPEVLAADAVDTGRLDGASGRRVLLVVLAIILAIELVPFQIVLVSLGAQKIAAAFPAAGNQTAWILTIWGLVGGALTPLLGKLSDIVGKKNVMTFSLLVAGAGLLIDALTTSWPLFLAGRALAGFAYPAIIISYGLIRDLVPRQWVSTAVGFVAGGSGLTAVIGPVVGGLLSDHYSWRSFFWFMFIFALVTVPVFVLLVPETKLRTRQRLDLGGAAILAAGVALILLYLNEGQSWGWGRPATMGWLLGGLALLVVFPFWERTQSAPLIDLGLVRTQRVWTVLLIGGIATTISVGVTYAVNYMAQTPGNTVRQGVIQGVAAQAGQALHTHMTPAALKALGVGITFNDPLRYALGLSLMQVAIRISLAITIVMVIVAPLAGWLFMKTGVYRPMIAALLVSAAGTTVFAFFHYSITELLLAGCLWALSVGALNAANPNLIVEGVPQHKQGASAGLFGAASAFGTALGGTIFTAAAIAHPFRVIITAPGRKPTVASVPQVYADGGYTEVFVIFTVIALAALLVVVFLMRFARQRVTGGLRY